MTNLIVAEGALLFVVLVGMPIFTIWSGKRRGTESGPRLKGLGLPEGSIRGMLALMSVGSFVILLVLGPGAPEMKEYFDKTLAAFGTLTGAIIGFYFGNRGSTTESARENNIPSSRATELGGASTTTKPAGTELTAESGSELSATEASSTTGQSDNQIAEDK